MRGLFCLFHVRPLMSISIFMGVLGLSGSGCGGERAFQANADSFSPGADGALPSNDGTSPISDGGNQIAIEGAVTVITDKSEYFGSEPVVITISNKISKDIYLEVCHPLHPEYFEGMVWNEPTLWACKKGGYYADTYVRAGTMAVNKSFASRFDEHGNTVSGLKPGTWRFRLDYGLCAKNGSDFTCYDVKTVYSNSIKIKPPSTDDPCALQKDIIPESEKGNYACEETPGCEWKALGGKIEMKYACCPKGFIPSDYSADSPIYKRCAIIID